VTDSTRDALEHEIARLEMELSAKRRMLNKLNRQEILKTIDLSENPFAGVKPLPGAVSLLKATGHPMERKVLEDLLMEGGYGVDKITEQKARWAIDFAFNASIKSGSLAEIDGLLGLPEWEKKGKFSLAPMLRPD
jgi:hypothetical protein